ncbi:hypothetical protein ACHAXT_010070 [Thalassiosira profunda]
MGQCCARCLHGGLGRAAESSTSDELLDGESVQVHSIDIEMSAPSISIANDYNLCKVAGFGLALADVPIEQDKAYFEWRVNIVGGGTQTLRFGVSNKRNSKFYEILAESTLPPEKHGTKFMCPLSNLKDGDVVGVAVQQSDFPVIQLNEGQVSRIRGTVFPAVYLPPESDASATFLFRDDQFVHGPPAPGLEPLMAERSLM